ncbi:RNA polymerase sigma-70 factor [Flavobacterium hibernum]|uniref:RNA polymerase sigma-70 factor n=1 Tax=Flavobacterium hibernum TaxID=37752 RepID=UPI000A02EEB2|nr:RNA polymerase sigma-70 factor [Flavobacterium hibernum]
MSLDNGNIKIDEAYYKELFYSLYPRLVSYSYGLVKDNFLAEEVVGNVMLQLWENRVKFEKIIDVKSYLYTMVRNGSFLILKNEQKGIQLNNELSHETLDFDFNILEEELYATLIEALNSLPEKCKEVFELSCIEGLKYRDIAEQLNISINTVKSQRARAIELLKVKLRNHSELLFLLLFL